LQWSIACSFNLGQNALKFARQKGKMTLLTRILDRVGIPARRRPDFVSPYKSF